MENDEDRRMLIGRLNCMRKLDCKLKVIDYPIDIDTRVASWQSLKQRKIENPEMSRWKFTLQERRPAGIEYVHVTKLDLNHARLSMADLRAMPLLETLLLRDNAFESLTTIIGISDLKNLKVRSAKLCVFVRKVNG